jgi:hypothetical protein
MCVKCDQAVDLYKKAYQSEQKGEATLAEVYYLKSWSLFEQAGGSNYLNAANSLNSLAFLRWSHKDYEGALCSAKKSIRILEAHGSEFPTVDGDFIQNTAWAVIDQVSYEMSLL